MRRFIRTGAGKTALFMLFVLSVIVLALSAAGIVGAVEYADYIYLGTEEQFTDELFRDRLVGDGYSMVWKAALRGDEGPLYDQDQGNLIYIVKDENGNIVLRSESSADVSRWQYELYYAVMTDGRNPEEGGEIEVERLPSGTAPVDSEGWADVRVYTVSFSFAKGFSEPDIYKLIGSASHYAYKLRYAVYAIALAALLAAVLSFVALMFASGHRPDTEEIVPGPLSKVPFDLLLAAVAGFAVLSFWLAVDGPGDIFSIGLFFITAVVLLCLVTGLCMSLACRIKQGTFLKNNITAKVLMLISGCIGAAWGIAKRVFSYFREGLRNMSVVWKTVLVFLGFTFLELMVLAAVGDAEEGALLLAIERFLILPGIVIVAVTLKKLYRSGQALAAGDLSYYTDTKGMFWDLKRHGEDLNNIAKGMAIAVDDRLRSERMKTELITNVSHDIKTPLTSIINYATLISEEKSGNERIDEYTEVLVRQSERLKRLIEDLVEASKASTGNLEVEPVPCSATVFLDQASGEYSEKLEAADLTLVTKAPEKEMTIMADGRRMWRIFDNLMNNICKYAMPGTRVYLSLEEADGRAVFTFKNTSREELDISEEELMERFTRGDKSRNTEGNGLGLSIAKSLAELQGGMLELSIDGDLFKATVSFPVIGN